MRHSLFILLKVQYEIIFILQHLGQFLQRAMIASTFRNFRHRSSSRQLGVLVHSAGRHCNSIFGHFGKAL